MVTERATEQATTPGTYTVTEHPAIDPVAGLWDQFIPRDLPHLRAGMIRAVERGHMVRQPGYLLVTRDGGPVAAAVTYTLLLDTSLSMSPWWQRWVGRGRKVWPGLLWRPIRICGSPISNAECGIYFSPRLSLEERREVFRQIVQQVQRSAGFKQAIFFKDFHPEQVQEYAHLLEELGYFPCDAWAGTRLEVAWSSFDDYLKAMKKRYRKQLRDDLKAGEGLDFQLLTSFEELAPRVAALYQNVLCRATFNLEKATPEFFAALSGWDQVRLLVARPRGSDEVIGFNLLLFGDSCMHNLYIGFDYEQNQKTRVYFNLVEQSLRAAIEKPCRVCYFGSDSYDFKARLGFKPFPLTAYMKHQLPFVHRMLLKAREEMFPKNEAVERDVFPQPGERE